MPGIYHYLLALTVACAHIWTDQIWWDSLYAILLLGGDLLFAIICYNEQYSKLFVFGTFVPAHFVAMNIAAFALYLSVEKRVNLHFRDRTRNSLCVF